MEDHFASTPRITYFGTHKKFDNTEDFKHSLSNFFDSKSLSYSSFISVDLQPKEETG
jgi:hypothetical protein